MPRLAANLSFLFTEVPFLERFAAAADAGFDAVEFLFPYDHPAEAVQERAAAAGVEVVLFNLPPGDWDGGERGIAVFPDRSADFTAGLQKAAGYARRLGTRRLHLMAGLAPSTDNDARGRYGDALREACDTVVGEGITILIEPLNGRDMPGYFLDSFEMAAEMIADLDRPNLKLQFDIYHRQIMRGDVLRGLEQHLPSVGHVQIASVPHRNEPGSGELDDFRILRELDRMGYSGAVGCEYRPRGTTVGGLDWRMQLAADGGSWPVAQSAQA
jgi:hydroxypyruvate isomerase